MIEQILLLVLFVVLSGVFSSTEIAMFSMSEVRIRHLVEQKVKGAKLLLKLKNDSHKLLITILIGNNIANIAGASIATKVALDAFGDVGVGIATGIMTLIILVAGEISPKAFATVHKQRIALQMAPVIAVLMKLFYPLVWVFDKITTLIVPSDQEIGPLITEDEVRDMLKLSEEQGSIKEQEEEMIQNIFKLDDTMAVDIMTPRPDVLSFQQDKKVHEVIEEVLDKGYSRIPIFEEDLDSITGLLYMKDLINIDPHTTLKDLSRPVFFVPETKQIDYLLRDFKQKKMHLAVIVNEHGTMVGVVSIEDIIEEIVGEIYDETDTIEDQEEDIKQFREQEYIMKGRVELEEVEEELGVHFNHEDHNTLSGFLVHKLNRMPKEHDTLTIKKWKFIVKKVEQNRILTVHVHKV